jgi:hypothetical protein
LRITLSRHSTHKFKSSAFGASKRYSLFPPKISQRINERHLLIVKVKAKLSTFAEPCVGADQPDVFNPLFTIPLDTLNIDFGLAAPGTLALSDWFSKNQI